MPTEAGERFQTLHELVKAAKLRLNANIWDYLVGATETETTMQRNRAALDAWAGIDTPGIDIMSWSKGPGGRCIPWLTSDRPHMLWLAFMSMGRQHACMPCMSSWSTMLIIAGWRTCSWCSTALDNVSIAWGHTGLAIRRSPRTPM